MVALLDEPTAAMDELAERHFITRFREWSRRSHGGEVATHRLRVLRAEVDRVIVIDHGMVILDQPKKRRSSAVQRRKDPGGMSAAFGTDERLFDEEGRGRLRDATRMLRVLAAMVVAFLVWTWFAALDEVATGTGKVVPTSRRTGSSSRWRAASSPSSTCARTTSSRPARSRAARSHPVPARRWRKAPRNIAPRSPPRRSSGQRWTAPRFASLGN